MTFKEEIELQSKDNKVLSYEILTNLKEKTYWSGRPKEIGDTVLFGMVEIEEQGEVFLRLITFHEEEIGVLYEENTDFYSKEKPDKFPRLKKIENGN
jgi:hypothetical protein